MGGRRQLQVGGFVRPRIEFGTTYCKPALSRAFGSGATASIRTISQTSTTSGSRNWRWCHLPGNPRMGGRRHSPDWRDRWKAPIAAARPVASVRAAVFSRGHRRVIDSPEVLLPADLRQFDVQDAGIGASRHSAGNPEMGGRRLCRASASGDKQSTQVVTKLRRALSLPHVTRCWKAAT